MKDNHKVLITGTGRSGTTFLVCLLTEFGLDTGIDKNKARRISKRKSKAGVEFDIISNKNTPYIVKSPTYCHHIEYIIKSGIKIDHIYIPIRNIDDVTKSRIKLKDHNHGGLWGVIDPNSQRDFLCKALGILISDLICFDIPHTFIRFDKLISDANYCYDKLILLLDGINKERFIEGFNKINLMFSRKK